MAKNNQQTGEKGGGAKAPAWSPPEIRIDTPELLARIGELTLERDAIRAQLGQAIRHIEQLTEQLSSLEGKVAD